MFRDMRRNSQKLTDEESVSILQKATSGVLAVIGDEDYPYAVPLSYVYCDFKIYIHCATQGHKLDAIRKNSKVSFCVIEQDNIVPEKFTTYFRSVIAFGKGRVIEDTEEKINAIRILAEKYCPDVTKEQYNAEVSSAIDRMAMIEITIEHMTGKEAIELVKDRR